MDRRTLLAGSGTLLIAAALIRDAHARGRTVPVTPQDSGFMQIAIDQAKAGDSPFGAIIVREDKVLALGSNATKRNHDPTAHAVMVAIRAFLAGHEPDDFMSATIYASSEPCPMCMGAIIWCGFQRLVYGASIDQLSSKVDQIDVSARRIANAAPFANIGISGGLLSGDAMRLFSEEEKKK
jgi:tRNA(adenine34) deaminase